MSNTSLEHILKAKGLADLWEQVAHLKRNAILIKPQAVAEDTLPLGASKLGGCADLPPSLPYPMHKDKPMSLIAQINFAETRPFDHEGRLPEKGILWLFYDVENGGWGFDPKDADGFCVYYFDGDLTTLARQATPEGLSDYGIFPAAALSFRTREEIPCELSYHMEDVVIEDEDAYEAWVEETLSEESFISKLLGHSDNIQGSMEDECQLVTHGLYCGDSSGYLDSRAKSLRAGSKDWELLLQIDSEYAYEMMWGDMGCLYLWIKKDDLAARCFEKSWLISQCH